MISKKIHYCWFGRNPLPKLTLMCIESWKKYLPDFEIIEWNEDNFDIDLFSFTKEAYEAKKYAFVSDVCRLYVLNKFGGIYLDTDMEILKPFDLLETKFLIGFEDINYVNAGIIFSTKENHFLKVLLEKYQRINFNDYINKLSDITIPKIVTDELISMGLVLNNKYQVLNNEIEVYPSEYFYPLNYFTGKKEVTTKTIAIHHYDSSWMTSKQKKIYKIKTFLISIFGSKFITYLITIVKSNVSKKSS